MIVETYLFLSLTEFSYRIYIFFFVFVILRTALRMNAVITVLKKKSAKQIGQLTSIPLILSCIVTYHDFMRDFCQDSFG